MHLQKPSKPACTTLTLCCNLIIFTKLMREPPANVYEIYSLAIQLFKLYNSNGYSIEWINLNLNQVITSRQLHFRILQTNKLRVGANALTNRLSEINGKIPLQWLNLTYGMFKIKCKKMFL